MEILRLGLERGRTAAEATEVMTGLITEYGQGKFENDADVRTYDNGYIVSDPGEAYIIQTAGHEWAVERVDGAVGISNVYSVETDWDRLSPGAESHAIAQGWWEAKDVRFNYADAYSASDRTEGSGARRLARSCAVLAERSGGIDFRTMMALLSDHSDGTDPSEPFQTAVKTPPCICVHHQDDGTGGNTAASLVADFCSDGSRLPVYWCSLYSPCLGLFFPVFIEGELPAILSVGDGTPSDESPWWGFHRLSRAARAGSGEGVDVVRERWVPLQQRLFDSAYEVAAEGRRLLDDSRESDVSTLLSGFMSEAVSDMMGELSRILDDLGGVTAEHAVESPGEAADKEGLPF
jgi:secernin